MKKNLLRVLLLFCVPIGLCAQPTIKLTNDMLMHEMRSTPSPLNKAVVSDRSVSLQWPLLSHDVQANLDGMEKEDTNKPNANKVNYRIRLSQDASFKKDAITANCSWAFYNPQQELAAGKWYWQYGYVEGNDTCWSDLLQFEVAYAKDKFSPPVFNDFVKKVPQSHPRILVFADEWDEFVAKSDGFAEKKWYLDRAQEILKEEIKSFDSSINLDLLKGLDTEMKRNAMITREGRRVVDREEANLEVLIRSYVLTKNDEYFDAAMLRLTEMIGWRSSVHFSGDFNRSTILSLSSLAYDSFYSKLSDSQKKMLLDEILDNGNKIFTGFVNHLENHIADNHTWQMNLRIFTMAAFAVYGDLPQADRWVDYSYNIWLARFPGLNKDGAWHNGDSYFHVNMRTLVEVPYFYSKVSGYNFFGDKWYEGNARYVMYQQPPFSKSAGNGSSHLRVVKPSGVRVGYADALAKMTNNGYLSDYVQTIVEAEPNVLKTAFMAKPGDLSWFRMQCRKPLPERMSLGNLPLMYVFPQTGVATLMSDWKDIKHNAMLTFRSSPYGSTSHAIANQNGFNTFYGGKSLFYSSGHHISFTDAHSFYSHRSTRAHNTILVDGMGQKIGTEGYGWIPRSYTGKGVSYLLGDASNAYGEVVSPLWIERGKVAPLEYTPANGWDKNHLKTYRRHIVELGSAELIFVYDELEADKAVSWNYLLHTVENPMVIKEDKNYVHIQATNGEGVSDAYLMSPDKLKVESTDQFFAPAINWLRADDKGNFMTFGNHWHFTASSPKKDVYRYATIISTHDKDNAGLTPKFVSDNVVEVGDWTITMNLTSKGKAQFTVKNKKKDISLIYNDDTVIEEGGKSTRLVDQVPELEI